MFQIVSFTLLLECATNRLCWCFIKLYIKNKLKNKENTFTSVYILVASTQNWIYNLHKVLGIMIWYINWQYRGLCCVIFVTFIRYLTHTECIWYILLIINRLIIEKPLLWYNCDIFYTFARTQNILMASTDAIFLKQKLTTNQYVNILHNIILLYITHN